MTKIRTLLLGLLAIMTLVLVLNWSKIQRLYRVNNLFEKDVIVQNFTQLDQLMFSQVLPASGDAHEWPEDEVALPETVTINGEPRDLTEFLDVTSTTALLVIQDGVIRHESYYLGTSPDDRRISWSVAKSFLSALLGIAVENGQIASIDDPVTNYVPSLAGTAYDGATIRNVLNMASGVKFNEDYLDKGSDINRMGRVLALGGSMDDFARSLEVSEREPGSGRQYVSIDTHVIGMVLRGATGQSVHDFFIQNLWSKLGPSADAYYLTDGENVAFVLGGLNMRTRDFALFGQMMLQNGVWNGEPIIPADWVAESTVVSAPADVALDDIDYGYQWWVPKGSQGEYFAVGVYGQYIYIDPNAGIVIVKNSAHREFEEDGPSGLRFKLENIDVFRSIVDHYAAQE